MRENLHPIDPDPDPSWRKRRKCEGLPTSLFFPELEKGGTLRPDLVAAMKLCYQCPVQGECLRFSARSHDTWVNGVYGGTTGGWRRQNLNREATKMGVYWIPEEVPDLLTLTAS